MNNESSSAIVIIKPDAIGVLAPKRKALRLVNYFVAYLEQDSTEFTVTGCDSNKICSHDVDAASAIQQINERSRSEKAFKGELPLLSDKCRSRFNEMKKIIETSRVDISELIILGIKALGFTVLKYHYVLSDEDVNAIYSLDANANSDLANELHEYLELQHVIIVEVYGDIDYFILQHWKLFVRHFLLRRTVGYKTKNLLHVCESDYSYVKSLSMRDKTQYTKSNPKYRVKLNRKDEQ